jgi:transposase
MNKLVDMSDALKQVRSGKAPEQEKMVITNADKLVNNKAYQNYKSGDDRYTPAKDLEEQRKMLEEQLKTAEKELEELYIAEDKAFVVRFKRIKDKERMVVVFRNQKDADMYADNVKKQGGQIFSNKLEKLPMGMKIKEDITLDEAIKGLQNKAKKTGMPYSILKKVYDRGMAAWKGGHRPGASQHQWAFARVNSFVTKSSGTWGGADKDLAAKVRGSK